jgi:hypothetical protein
VNRTTIKIGQESKPKSGVGISYQEVVAPLEADGVEKFVASWDELIHTVSSALPAERRSCKFCVVEGNYLLADGSRGCHDQAESGQK